MTGHMGSHMTVHMTGHVTGDMTVHMTVHMTWPHDWSHGPGGHMTDHYMSMTYPLLFLQWEPSLFEGSTVVAHPEGTAVLTIGAHVFLMRGKRSLAFTHMHHTHTHTHTWTNMYSCARTKESRSNLPISEKVVTLLYGDSTIHSCECVPVDTKMTLKFITIHCIYCPKTMHCCKHTTTRYPLCYITPPV